MTETEPHPRPFTDDATAAPIREAMAAYIKAGATPHALLRILQQLTRAATDTRPSDWCVRFGYGPVSLYQRIEGGRATFRRPTGRHIVEYTMDLWPLRLAYTLWARAVCRWKRETPPSAETNQ
ncbi:MAG: hypothetical protein AAF589_04740 [Planctomycetota bacterium]